MCTAAAAAPAAPVDPVVVATKFWETIPLPAPKPTAPPGFAITGKTVYLVTDGQLAPAEFHQQTVIGPLAIKATGAYDVNWGDGTTTGPYATEGLPYPLGTITHSYDNVGTYTVTVTELWSASWSLGAAGGVLNQLHTEGVIDNFPVRQVQAVITG